MILILMVIKKKIKKKNQKNLKIKKNLKNLKIIINLKNMIIHLHNNKEINKMNFKQEEDNILMKNNLIQEILKVVKYLIKILIIIIIKKIKIILI